MFGRLATGNAKLESYCTVEIGMCQTLTPAEKLYVGEIFPEVPPQKCLWLIGGVAGLRWSSEPKSGAVYRLGRPTRRDFDYALYLVSHSLPLHWTDLASPKPRDTRTGPKVSGHVQGVTR
jgi:hypothetical protein